MLALLSLQAPATAAAKELQVIGRASVNIGTSNPQDVKASALKQAKRNAVSAAVEKILGPGATKDPRVASKLDQVSAQIGDEQVIEAKGSAANGAYDAAVTLVLDDKDFRTLLSDLGVAVNTATVRSFTLLAVMDEFLTTPRDLKAPLEELEMFRSEVGNSSHDRSKASAAASSTSASASASETYVDGKAASSRSASGSYDQGVALQGQGGSASAREKASASVHASDSASIKAADKRSAAKSASSASASSSAKDVAAEQHDNQFYMKLVKYQPQGGSPEKTSQAYNAFVGQLQDYDLRVLDNDVFRSKHFKNRPMTIQQMQDGAALVQYVEFARSEANADFFMVGTSIIIDSGKSANTGDLECTGVVTLKTYSTVDSESIASETFSEASTGRNINDCAGNLAKKIAAIGGPIIGARVQEYWKRRSTYGREYTLTLVGTGLPLMVKTAFTKALKAVPGVENDVQRASTTTRLQMVVTYKGTDPLDQAMASSLAANPAFATLDSRTTGNQVFLCMGPCDETEKAAAKKEGKK
jgi:hypothetical protein